MTVFEDYADFYDLFYSDKDYRGEAIYIHDLIGKFAEKARSVLDLGCGTGIHALSLAGMGYEVYGVDRSPKMVKQALDRLEKAPEEISLRLFFGQGDIRHLRISRHFDVATALFHVMSYLTDDRDLLAALKSVRAHLSNGGLLIFDCWYGPAVRNDPPVRRLRHWVSGPVRVSRLAVPEISPAEPVVAVHYDITVRDETGTCMDTIRETHRMRYLFDEDVAILADLAGFVVVGAFAWRSSTPPTREDWNACFVLRSKP